jgi:hypothetical protein
MSDKKPFIPHRWVEILSLDHAFEMLELDRMPDYGFTAATIWTSFESFDNYNYTLPLLYKRQADLNAVRDQNKIRSGSEFLREFSRRAHHHGMQVMHVYHLCNFVGPVMPVSGPSRLPIPTDTIRAVRPQWLNDHGEIDFAKPDFYNFMADEVEDFFDTFPHLDGLFCWNCECSTFTPSRLKHQTIPTAEICARAMRGVYGVCRKRNKLMSHDIHTAGADAELTRGIIAAAKEMPEVILGADATYSDWHMHLPTTPWLAEMGRHNRIYVGFDAAGEFFGQARTVGGWPRWITTHFDAAKRHNLAAVSARSCVSNKENSAVLVPMLEFNLRLIADLARDGRVDLDQHIAAWWKRHFSGALPAGMKDVLLSFEAILEKMMYINGTNITEYNPDHGYPPKAITRTPGYPIWHSEQFAPPGTPIPEIMARMIPTWGHRVRPVEALRQEKRDALALCEEALGRLEGMQMAPEDRDYFTRAVRQAHDVSESWLHTINVVYALYQIMIEHHDKSMTDPRTELRVTLVKHKSQADAMETRWGPTFYRRFVPKMRAFAADIEENVPL